MKKNERPFIKQMFNTIAPWYDFLNRFLSMRQDVIWRRNAVESLNLPDNPVVLDMACGTCDVGLEILKQNKSAKIISGDFSWQMLKISREKITKVKKDKHFSLISANALFSPFKTNTFDGLTIAFGIRNIINRKEALENFCYCLKPGARIAVLELTTPENRFLKTLYLFYFQKILPFIGGILSKNFHAYSYLPESVLKFPSSAEFAEIMENAGFKEVQINPQTFGISTIFTAVKPE